MFLKLFNDEIFSKIGFCLFYIFGLSILLALTYFIGGTFYSFIFDPYNFELCRFHLNGLVCSMFAYVIVGGVIEELS